MAAVVCVNPDLKTLVALGYTADLIIREGIRLRGEHTPVDGKNTSPYLGSHPVYDGAGTLINHQEVYSIWDCINGEMIYRRKVHRAL